MEYNMPTDMQYKDNLRKDLFLNNLIMKALENNDVQTALEYLKENQERIEKALEE